MDGWHKRCRESSAAALIITIGAAGRRPGLNPQVARTHQDYGGCDRAAENRWGGESRRAFDSVPLAWAGHHESITLVDPQPRGLPGQGPGAEPYRALDGSPAASETEGSASENATALAAEAAKKTATVARSEIGPFSPRERFDCQNRTERQCENAALAPLPRSRVRAPEGPPRRRNCDLRFQCPAVSCRTVRSG